jgi:hypothetical protein
MSRPDRSKILFMNSILRHLRGLLVITALTSGLTGFAQTVQFFTLQKGQNFIQTDATTVTAMPLNPGLDMYPWRLETDINGSGLTTLIPTPPNTVIPPLGSGTVSYNMTPPDGMGHGWQYRTGFSTQSAMDTALNNGIYSVSLGGATSAFTLNLAGDLYPNSPLAALTGGSWNAGTQRYDVNPAGAWSISTGLFNNANFLWNMSRVEIDIWGGGVDFTKDIGAGSATPFLNTDTNGSLSLFSTDSGAPTFIAGNTYMVDVRFARVIDFHSISTELGLTLDPTAQAQGVTMYESELSFSIQAIPEPSTYAAWAGLLALGLVAWRRHRTA